MNDKRKRNGEQRHRLLTKIFDKAIWGLAAGFFVILTIIAFVGGAFADKYSANLNTILNIQTQDIVGDGEEYYSTDFYSKDGSGYDNEAMRAHSLEVSAQAASEGAVLLWNNKLGDGSKALPISAGSKVSLFGVATQKYLVAGGGSGYVGINTTDTVRSKLEDAGVEVNTKLWNAYNILKANYGYYVVGDEAKKRVGDDNYWEYRIREIPWNTLDSSTIGNVTDTVSEYGDAAVMTVTRYTSEDGDTNFDTSIDYGKSIYADNNLDNNYMDLSADENDVIKRLVALREAGKVKRVVLLINTASPLQMKHIKDLGIDACIWVGMGGSASYAQIANVLTGAIAPSGRLADTIAFDHYSSPVTANFGDMKFASKGGVPENNKMTMNDRYVVYQEGIYMGYRYYETRYEDAVLGKYNADVYGSRNAASAAGVTAGNADSGWKYSDEVAYPFGYGLTYTDFKYSDFKVEQKGDDYEVSVKITNNGDLAGKEVFQIYLQKPYTEYDIDTGIEKSAVELVGFDKTDVIQPKKSQTLTVTVKGEDFKTYDSYGKKTYILERGDYYLAVGVNAHDALNNILARKGCTDAHGMDYNGKADFAKLIRVDADDFVKYSKTAKGFKITNRFDNADINVYTGTADQHITYLSRKDWSGTYPAGVSLSCVNAEMVKDMQYGYEVTAKPTDKLPVTGKITVSQDRLDKLNEGREEDKKQNRLWLINLMEYNFDDPLWDDLLNQMTWEEQSWLLTYGYCRIAGISNIGSKEIKANDGPAGIKGDICPGLKSYMCFPSQQVLAATWNLPLVKKIGDAFGMEMLHAGYTAVYGPGAGIHRSAFSGRNFEYYSEDGFISGKMFAAETSGLQSRGVIVFAKHLVLNDQEKNRYGGTVWANEQTIREIYLKAFEAGVIEGKANGIMTSHNRIGCIWSGGHSGLLTDVLRKEWGFTGITITDAAVSDHEFNPRAMASAVVAGQDLWMYGGNNKAWDGYKNNATVALAVREACHRILYNQLHSNGMNNITADTQFRDITPWWKNALVALQAVSVCLLVACAVMAILGAVFGSGQFKKMYVAKCDGTYVKPPCPYQKEKGFKGFFINIGRGYAALSKKNKIITIVACSVGLSAVLAAIIAPCAVYAVNNRPAPPPAPPLPRELYTFEAEDGKVELGAGTIKGNVSMPYVAKEAGAEQAYIGGISTNVGATITFYVNAESSAIAELIISVSQNNRYAPLLGAITVFINGEMIESRGAGIDFEGEESWVKFCDVSLGDIALEEGLNTVQIMQISESRGNNIDCIRLDSTSALELKGKPSPFGDDEWTKTEINVGDGGALSDGVSVGSPAFFTSTGYENGYIGNLSGNKGAYVTFEANVDADCEAVLYLVSNKRKTVYNFDDAYKLTVNGEQINVTAAMPSGSDGWTDFVTTGLCKINLVAAKPNTVTIEIVSDNGGIGANIAGIVISADGRAISVPAHVCGHKCEVCDLCRDAACNKRSCADKCQGHDEGVVFDFDAVTDSALSSGVSIANGEAKTGPLTVNNRGYLGGVAMNYNASITFNVNADKAGKAKLYLTVSERDLTTQFVFDDAYRLCINGLNVSSNADMSRNAAGWEAFRDYFICEAELKAGDNIIAITVVDTRELGSNFKGIKLKSETLALTWASEKSDAKHNVSYDLDGGIKSDSATFADGEKTSGAKFVLPSASEAVKDGHTLIGWTDGIKTYDTGADYVAPAYGITLKAVWKTNGEPAPVHECADKCPTCDKCTTECAETACAEKCEGHTPPVHECADKCPTCDKCTTECAETACAEKCEGHDHNAAFDLDGGDGEVPDTIYSFGEKFNLPASDGIVKEACVFVGWSDGETTYNAGDEYTMPDNDVLFMAVWREYPAYAFDVVTDGVQNENVILKSGSSGFVINSDHIGGVAKNEYASMIFDVSADKSGSALLYFTVCDRAGAFTFGDAYALEVNGVDVSSDTDMSQTDTRWTTFNSYLIAEVTLVQGKNRIAITVLPTGDLDLAGNVKGITLKSDSAVCTPYVSPDKSWTFETDLNALTDGVLSEGVKTNSNVNAGENCLGQMNAKGRFAVFTVSADADCTAALYLNVSNLNADKAFCDAFDLYVNGRSVTSYVAMPRGKAQWTDYDHIKLELVEFGAGVSEIVFVGKGFDYNIRGIKFVTETERSFSLTSGSPFGYASEWNSVDIAFADENGIAQGIRTSGGVFKDGACAALGNIAGNTAAEIGFTVNATSASRAVIFLDASEHGNYLFGQAFELKVNGKTVDSFTLMPKGNSWTTFVKIAIAEIDLEAGDNEITIKVISSDGGVACNLAGATIGSENAAVTLKQ